MIVRIGNVESARFLRDADRAWGVQLRRADTQSLATVNANPVKLRRDIR